MGTSLPELERIMVLFQGLIASRVIVEDRLPAEVSLVGGVDVAYDDDSAYAAACLFVWPELGEINHSISVIRSPYPYRPGVFVMREGPPAARAVKGLSQQPHLLFVNGGGIDHPRGLGLASHLGVILNMPTIGITRKPVAGEVRDDGVFIGTRKVGTMLKAGKEVSYVSPGHMVSVDGARNWVKKCATGKAFPKPLIVAHARALESKKQTGKKDE